MPSGAGSVRSEPWRRTTKSPRAQRESSYSPEPPQRAQDRSRGAPQIRQAERDRSVASLGGEQQNPLAHSAKAPTPQSLLSERRTDPAKPSPANSDDPKASQAACPPIPTRAHTSKRLPHGRVAPSCGALYDEARVAGRSSEAGKPRKRFRLKFDRKLENHKNGSVENNP
jgi:hypothetical protein